jgi:hypothetical protein
MCSRLYCNLKLLKYELILRTFQNAYIVPPEDGRKWVDHVGVNNITIVVMFYVFCTMLVLAMQVFRE